MLPSGDLKQLNVYKSCMCFVYLEYGEGVISYYPCCQGNRGSSGCQIAKVDASIFSVQYEYVTILRQE